MNLSSQERNLDNIEWKIISYLLDTDCFEKIDKIKSTYFSSEARGIFIDLQKTFITKGIKLSREIIESRYSIDIPKSSDDPKLFDEYVTELKNAYERHVITEGLQRIDLNGDTETVKRKLFDLLEFISGETVSHFNLATQVDGILKNIQDNIRPEGIPTGIHEVDKITGGLLLGDFNIIAGRPSMGKSALSQQIMVKNSYQTDNCTLYYTLEDSTDNILMRCISHITGVPFTKILLAELDNADKQLILGIIDDFKKSPIEVYDSFFDVYSIIAHARKRKLKNKNINLIVVDYIQLISGDGSRLEITSEASRLLKLLGMDINVSVICVSQLSRKSEEREDKRPFNSDLRDTGTLEQDASRIIFPWRPYQYSKDEAEKEICEYIIGKNKHGEVKTVIGKCFISCFQFS